VAEESALTKWPDNFKSLLQRGREDRRSKEREWDLCRFMVRGDHYLDYNKTRRSWLKVPKINGRTQATINRILGIYRNVVSRLSTAYPSVAVMPVTESTEDLNRARAMEFALQYYWQKDRIDRTFAKIIRWLVTTGGCAVHTYWRGSKEHGDVHTSYHSPYDVFFEPGVEEQEESQWIALRRFVHRDVLLKAYKKPEAQKIIRDAPVATMDDEPTRRAATSAPDDRIEMFLVYWTDGTYRYAEMVEGQYLNKGTLPFKKVPVQFIGYTPMCRELFPPGLIRPLIEVQLLYNRARSQVFDNQEVIANPKWAVHRNSGVQNTQITSRPGEKVFYTGKAPFPIKPPEMPTFALQSIDKLDSEMQALAGVHSTDLGRRSVGINSGAAIRELSQRGASQLQMSMDEIESAAREMAETALSLMKIYYTEDRMIRMFDHHGKTIMHELANSDLQENPSVYFTPGSMFRDSAEIRDAKILDLVEKKLIPPEEARQMLSDRNVHGDQWKKMEARSHAQAVLARLIALWPKYKVQLYAYEDLDAFAEVFKESINDFSKFYMFPLELQEYISAAYVAASTWSLPPEQREAAMANTVVFDKSTTKKPVGAPSEPSKTSPIADVLSPTPTPTDGESVKRQGALVGTPMGGVP